MPHTAMEILRLSSDPAACADDLVRLVNQDPSLAAQIVRYARSPLFGRGGDVQAVEDAVHRVLGFDMVVSVAVGLATARIFRNPAGGPLGLNAFWQHATYTATLSQEFARHMPSDRRPPLGLAYLAGLLHNVGFLVLGHLFRPEFEILNRLVAVSPRSRVTDVERQVLAMGEARRAVGMGHARLGAVLMERWEMPEGVRVAVAEHHNPDYAGPHAEIAALVLLADRLTRRLALGDGDSEHLPERLLMRLGLSGDTLEAVFDRFLGVREGLDSMARRIAA
jgi:HD-like signal output (HDOD) protein